MGESRYAFILKGASYLNQLCPHRDCNLRGGAAANLQTDWAVQTSNIFLGQVKV